LILDINSTDLFYNSNSNIYFTNNISKKKANLIIKNLADRSLIYIFINIISANSVNQLTETFNINIILQYFSN